MSFLPLILLLIVLFKRNNSNFTLDFLKDIDISSLLPILELLGLKGDSLNLLNNDEFKNFLSGNGDIKSLIPLLLPLLKNFTTPTFNSNENYTENIKSEYLSPIKDIANDDITTTLENYFNAN